MVAKTGQELIRLEVFIPSGRLMLGAPSIIVGAPALKEKRLKYP